MATNFVRASYTEVIDLQTVNGKCSIVGIHTPTGRAPYEKLEGFFHQYKKYRYKGISSLVMAPAANLPVDPLGLTGVSGTTDLMDPRDALNPIMFHGVHGQAINSVVDKLFANHGASTALGNPNVTAGFISDTADKIDEDMTSSGSLSPAERSYYTFLTDPTWKKMGVQSLIRLKNLHPLVWKMARSIPLLPNVGSSTALTGQGDSSLRYSGSALDNGVPKDTVATTVSASSYVQGEVPNLNLAATGSGGNNQIYVQEFTNGVTRLGWLPTLTYGSNGLQVSILPKLFMGVLVLPPAYNVEQFFRLSIRHVFEFADFTTNLKQLEFTTAWPNVGIGPVGYYNWIDYTDPEGGSKTVAVSDVDFGGTLDCIDAQSNLVSDGVN